MSYSSIVHEERRKLLIQQARYLIASEFEVYDADETCLYLEHSGFYLDVEFDEESPAITFSMNRDVDRPITQLNLRRLNELNLDNPQGQHAIHEELEHYLYRRTYPLDGELSMPRLLEIIGHCYIEALRGYGRLTFYERREHRACPNCCFFE